MDGCIRDLAALRGTYRLIPETAEAARMIFEVLQDASAGRIHVLLDAPVSNSGRLKVLMAETAEACRADCDIQVVRNVGQLLTGQDLVVTSDSVILDRCGDWFNLTAECLRRRGAEPLQVWDPAQCLTRQRSCIVDKTYT